jgi:hypothetical protein
MRRIFIFHKALLRIPVFTLTILEFHPPVIPLKNGTYNFTPKPLLNLLTFLILTGSFL